MIFSRKHLAFILAMLAFAGVVALYARGQGESDNTNYRKGHAATQSRELKPGLAPRFLPTSFVFVEDRGNNYFIYKDEYGFYLVYKDDLFAASVHIVYLGKGKQ